MWIANYNSSCTLHAVGDVIQEWGAAFAFPKGTSDSVLEACDRAILMLQQDTDLEDVFKVGLLRPPVEGSGGWDCYAACRNAWCVGRGGVDNGKADCPVLTHSVLAPSTQDKYLGIEDPECQTPDSREMYQLKFDQVAGLWVILGVAALAASLLLVLFFLGRHVPALRGLTMASLGRGPRRERGQGMQRRSVRSMASFKSASFKPGQAPSGAVERGP